MDIEKEIRKARKQQGIFAMGVLLIVASLAYMQFWAVSSWFGSTRFGASIYLDSAMKAGDGGKAVIYGTKLLKAFSNRNGELEYAFVAVRAAWAYELNKQYQDALGLLKCHAEEDVYQADFARINFKQGNKVDAFRLYCKLVSRHKCGEIGEMQRLRQSILRVPYAIESSFQTYADFVQFMESEYEKLGRPEEHREAMARIRQIQEDFNDAKNR